MIATLIRCSSSPRPCTRTHATSSLCSLATSHACRFRCAHKHARDAPPGALDYHSRLMTDMRECMWRDVQTLQGGQRTMPALRGCFAAALLAAFAARHIVRRRPRPLSPGACLSSSAHALCMLCGTRAHGCPDSPCSMRPSADSAAVIAKAAVVCPCFSDVAVLSSSCRRRVLPGSCRTGGRSGLV